MNLSRRAVIAGLFTLPLAAASIASTPDTARADTADQLAAAGMTVQRLLVNNMREVTLEDAKAIYAQVL